MEPFVVQLKQLLGRGGGGVLIRVLCSTPDHVSSFSHALPSVCRASTYLRSRTPHSHKWKWLPCTLTRMSSLFHYGMDGWHSLKSWAASFGHPSPHFLAPQKQTCDFISFWKRPVSASAMITAKNWNNGNVLMWNVVIFTHQHWAVNADKRRNRGVGYGNDGGRYFIMLQQQRWGGGTEAL